MLERLFPDVSEMGMFEIRIKFETKAKTAIHTDMRYPDQRKRKQDSSVIKEKESE